MAGRLRYNCTLTWVLLLSMYLHEGRRLSYLMLLLLMLLLLLLLFGLLLLLLLLLFGLLLLLLHGLQPRQHQRLLLVITNQALICHRRRCLVLTLHDVRGG